MTFHERALLAIRAAYVEGRTDLDEFERHTADVLAAAPNRIPEHVAVRYTLPTRELRGATVFG